ncbi:MAG: hypothetical protein K8S87_03730 [Planctomycetes bacterium]|nr:hypothetical protein [Planctomycetota bacterium]
MSNIVTCESCGAQYDATGYQPGVQFACTNCGTLVTVPTLGIELSDEPAASQYDTGQAVAEAADAKLRAHGVRAKKRRPAGQGARRQEPQHRQTGAPRKAGARPAQRGGGAQGGGHPKKRPAARQEAQPAGRAAPRKAGARGPAPKGRMANTGGRPAARGAQRSKQAPREDYYDEEEDFEEFQPKKDNTMLIVGIVSGVLVVIVIIALALMGGENTGTGEKVEEVIEDPYKAYRHLFNDKTVKVVVDGFMNAIQTGNDIEFQSYIDWVKVAANAQKPIDKVQEYFNMSELKKAIGYFNVSIDLGDVNYYNKRSGLDHNVGYGIWKLTPKGEIGSECQWIIKLKFVTQTQKWEVVNIGGLPEDVMGFKTNNFAIPDEERGLWVLYVYYFTPEQWVAFKKKEALDPEYVPVTREEWHHRDEVKTKKFEEGDYVGPDASYVKVPELIKNVNISGDYSMKISAIKNGELQASREFNPEDKNRDVVAELINIIIEGAKDGFKSKLSADAALEANKALMRIFDKTSGVDKKTYGFRISKLSDDGEAVDDETIELVADVVLGWIDEFKALGWSVE